MPEGCTCTSSCLTLPPWGGWEKIYKQVNGLPDIGLMGVLVHQVAPHATETRDKLLPWG